MPKKDKNNINLPVYGITIHQNNCWFLTIIMMIIIKIIKLMIKKKNNNVAIIYGISTIGFFTYFAHFFEINPVYFWNVSGRYRTDDRAILVQMVSKDILSTEMKHIIFLELCLTQYIKYVTLLHWQCLIRFKLQLLILFIIFATSWL